MLLNTPAEQTVFYGQYAHFGAIICGSQGIEPEGGREVQPIKAAMGKQGVVASDAVGLTMQGLSASCRGIFLSTFFRSRSSVPDLEVTLLEAKNCFGSNRV